MNRFSRVFSDRGPLCGLFALMALLSPANAGENVSDPLRPRYHFTAEKGYINDPNGLFFVDGVYHLFFQAGTIDAKCWGHAVSRDLLHWRQLEDALKPRDGSPAFSGSAVIDRHNTSGFQIGKHPPAVAAFTSWGEGQYLAYSNDQGMTWKRYRNNPVLRLPNDAKRSFPLSARDPCVVWDKTRKHWVMILYENLNNEVRRGVSRHKQGGLSFFTSPDLKTWTRQSHLPGFYVCPDLIELPIDGEDRSAWVLMDWERYVTGSFDGTTFHPDGDPLPLDYGSHQTLSANQTWKNLPDGRVVQICWIRGGKYPGMPFDQQLSFPTELSLQRHKNRLRLCKNPIREIASLHGKQGSVTNSTLAAGQSVELTVESHAYDLNVDLTVSREGRVIFDVLGNPMSISVDTFSVRDRSIEMGEPIRKVRVLADITSIEVFINDGLSTMTFTTLPPSEPQPVRLSAARGSATIHNAVMREVRTVWRDRSGLPLEADAANR